MPMGSLGCPWDARGTVSNRRFIKQTNNVGHLLGAAKYADQLNSYGLGVAKHANQLSFS